MHTERVGGWDGRADDRQTKGWGMGGSWKAPQGAPGVAVSFHSLGFLDCVGNRLCSLRPGPPALLCG